MRHILVTYFSASGETARLAKTIAQVAGAGLYEIRPVRPYTAADLNWHNPNSRSSVEMRDPDSRPEIAGNIPELTPYDTVFVGFPIWWYVAPTIINTFLESEDFSGKTVIPFATSGGSGVGETDKYLHLSCSEQTAWRPAKRFAGSASPAELQKWVEGLKL